MTADWLRGEPMNPRAQPIEPMATFPGVPFLHRNTGTIIVGPTGGGRSSLLETILYDAAFDGIRSAYLGSEISQAEFDTRAGSLVKLRGHNLDDETCEMLGSCVRYLDLRDTIAHAWSNPQQWIDGIVKNYELLAIDPISAVASALGMNFDNENAPFVNFYTTLIQPLVTAGLAVVLVDNVGHAEEAKARAKGASAKQDCPDLTFSCSLAPNGLVITAKKVRPKRAAFARDDKWLFTKDTQEIQSFGGATQSTSFRPTNIMHKISVAVETAPGMSARKIRESVGGNAKNVDLALALLVDESYIERRQNGQKYEHFSAEPFTDLPTVSTVSDRVQTVSETQSLNRVHRVSAPLGADTGHGQQGSAGNGQPCPAVTLVSATAIASQSLVALSSADETESTRETASTSAYGPAEVYA